VTQNQKETLKEKEAPTIQESGKTLEVLANKPKKKAKK
jgi:hypothetical protein